MPFEESVDNKLDPGETSISLSFILRLTFPFGVSLSLA